MPSSPEARYQQLFQGQEMNRSQLGIGSFVIAREARIKLFDSIQEGLPLDEARAFYLENSGIINHKFLHPIEISKVLAGNSIRFSNKDKAEALRRFDLDRSVAERYRGVDLLGSLIAAERSDLEQLSISRKWEESDEKFRDLNRSLMQRENTLTQNQAYFIDMAEGESSY